MAYTLPFLVPMLENAGATVFIPRERDWQVHEVIVDNDGSTGNSLYLDAENVKESNLSDNHEKAIREFLRFVEEKMELEEREYKVPTEGRD